MSVEDLLLRRCAKVLNLCDVVNGRYRLYFMSKSLEGGELCLRHDIYRLSHSQGTSTQFDWGALRGCKGFFFNNASNFCYKPAVEDTPSLRDLLRLLQWTF